MKNIFEQLAEFLKKDDRLVSDDGVLLKNKVQELARKNDPELIRLLLSDKGVKGHFFFDVDNALIFDKEKFIRFISNKQFLPDSYTAFKNKIGLTAGDEYVSETKEVVLVWPYKDCILEGGMTKEDQKRDEIFYNETLAPDDITRLLDPKVFTRFKRVDKDGEHTLDGFRRNEKGVIKDNLIVKGNNLLALASLKKEFAGKVKLIYIDPPYNTGNDGFKYNDSFNHSSWLVFMKNRLEIAKKLLSEDGVIFVQCDDKEQAYLKVLMDDLFGIDNFVNTIVVKMSEPSGVKMNHSVLRFPKIKEYLLFYKKNNFGGFVEIDKYQVPNWDRENNIFLENFSQEQRNILLQMEEKEKNNEDDLKKALDILKDVKRVSLSEKIKILDFKNCDDVEKWKFENSFRIVKTAGSSSLAKLATKLKKPNQDIGAGLSKENFLFFYITDFNKDTKQPRLQVIFADSNIQKNPCDFWQDIKTTGAIAEEGGVKLVGGKKPEKLIYRIIKMITKKGDIVFDFFAGSGTTLAVAHKMERQYIGIEQMDYIHDLPESRLKNVIHGDQTGISKDVHWQGGGDFVYMELAKWNEEWMEKIRDAKTDTELIGIWNALKENTFLSWRIDLKIFDENAQDFSNLPIADKKKALIECLDKNNLYVNLSEIEDTEYEIGEGDKGLNYDFYGKKCL